VISRSSRRADWNGHDLRAPLKHDIRIARPAGGGSDVCESVPRIVEGAKGRATPVNPSANEEQSSRHPQTRGKFQTCRSYRIKIFKSPRKMRSSCDRHRAHATGLAPPSTCGRSGARSIAINRLASALRIGRSVTKKRPDDCGLLQKGMGRRKFHSSAG
jgi:hypothetical protein